MNFSGWKNGTLVNQKILINMWCPWKRKKKKKNLRTHRCEKGPVYKRNSLKWSHARIISWNIHNLIHKDFEIFADNSLFALNFIFYLINLINSFETREKMRNWSALKQSSNSMKKFCNREREYWELWNKKVTS